MDIKEGEGKSDEIREVIGWCLLAVVAGTVAGNVGMAVYRDVRDGYSWVRRKISQRNHKKVEKQKVEASLVTLKRKMKGKRHRRFGSEHEEMVRR